MESGEIDEQLAMLCHTEIAGGAESLAGAVASLPRPELERLLSLAVVALLDAENRADREITRMARRLQERRSKES